MYTFGKLLNTRLFRNIRNVCKETNVRHKSAYDGPGKTTVHMLHKEFSSGLLIDSATESGFILHNGIMVAGPMIIFARSILSWDVMSAHQINEDSLSLFTTIYPKLDLVVLGLDMQYPYKNILELRKIFQKENIPVEIHPTDIACSIYNYTIAEDRYVAGALIPPKNDNAYLDNVNLAKMKQSTRIRRDEHKKIETGKI